MNIPKNDNLFWSNFLKEKGYKKTQARVAVLHTLSILNKPVRARDISNKLSNKVNEVTVYRILSLFEENGVVRRVNLKKDSIYFELNNDHHHHIVCIKCGYIEDFKENIEIKKTLEKIVEKSFRFNIVKEHSLDLFGVCNKCN